MSRSKKSKLEELRRRGKRREMEKKAGRAWLPELADVQRLIDRGKLAEAYARLRQLDAQYPRSREVLWMLAGICREMDTLEHQRVCRQLVELEPDDREALLMLAYAETQNDRSILALQVFRSFLERWPNDPRGEGVRESVAILERRIEAQGAEFKFVNDDAQETLVFHEEISEALLDRKFERVIELADRILARYPQFDAAHNNRAEALFHLGRLDEAIAECRRVLEYNAQNGFTLATITRFLFLRGDVKESQSCAVRLKSLEPQTLSAYGKTAETLSVLADHQGVLDVFEQARTKLAGFSPPCFDAGVLHHFAAAAHMELGNAAQARRLWEKALEWFPGLEFARENLADLQAPVDQRQGSWAVGFQGWLSLLAYEEFDRIVKSRQGGADPYAILQQRVLRLCPQLPRLVPLLLERGGPRACTFAWWIAATSDEREMLDALRAFALGQRGPDKMRLDALAVLRRKNVLPDRRLKMWLQGEWRDEMLYSWDIYSESVEHGWPREVGLLSSHATDALQEGEPELAESLLEKALEIQPNAPELLNNLTAVYSVQGRYEEVEVLAERIHRDHPDYWFGRTNLAVMLAHRGEIERARKLVDPLLDQQRLHVSEFSALCYTQAFLARAERKWNVALAWADQLERVLPNDPKVKMIRSWKRS